MIRIFRIAPNSISNGYAGSIRGRHLSPATREIMTARGVGLGAGLSVLDRLIDRVPESSVEGAASAWEEMRQIKTALCRDLSVLLNTRRGEPEFDADFAEATNSILTFGVADFTARNLKNRVDQDGVRLSLERAIRQFEPRITRVTVTVQEADAAAPVLRFEISASLVIDNGAEDIVFDAALHRDSRRVSVTGAAS
jgi:type VI secretion system protein ImpF